MLAVIVRDLSAAAHGGAALRNRALADAVRHVRPDSVVMETARMRNDAGCVRQCGECASTDLGEYGSLRSDPFPWTYCRRVCSRLAGLLADRGVTSALVSEIQQHRYFHAARAAGVPVALDLHNSEVDVFVDNAAHPDAEHLDPLATLDIEAVRAIEQNVGQSADLVTFVSEPDRSRFTARHPQARTAVIPNSVDLTHTTTPRAGTGPLRPDLVFLGHLDYFPNVQAAVTLIGGILPHLRRSVPGTSLTIAGRDPGPRLREQAGLAGVRLIANPPDIRPLLRNSIMVVPLCLGGGTRLKVLEAFAAGVPVISTAKGVEGIEATPDMHYLEVDDDPRSYVEQLRRIMLDRAADHRRRAAAYELVRRRYSWQSIRPAVGEVVGALESARSRVSAPIQSR